MFNISRSKVDVSKNERRKALDSLKLSFNNADTIQEELILKLQTRKRYASDTEGCKSVDFRKTSKIEYADKVFMQDLSTDEQVRLGLSIFHVKIDKTTSSPLHFHEERSQLLFIVKGSIYDDVTKMQFGPGESYFISKRNRHSIKYIEGSELLFIYMPSLKVIDDEQK